MDLVESKVRDAPKPLTALLITLQHLSNYKLIRLRRIQSVKLAFIVEDHFRSNNASIHGRLLGVDFEVDLLLVEFDDQLVGI